MIADFLLVINLFDLVVSFLRVSPLGAWASGLVLFGNFRLDAAVGRGGSATGALLAAKVLVAKAVGLVSEVGVLVNRQHLQDALRSGLLVGIDASASAVSREHLEQLRRRSLERALVPLDDATLVGLQRQASLSHQLGVIRERVNVRDSAYALRARQNWFY